MVCSYICNLIHKRNEILSYIEIPFFAYQMRNSLTTNSIGSSVDKQACSYVAVENMQHVWKHLAVPRQITSEKAMATHSSVLALRIPGTGEPGGLPSMGSHRVGHDWSNLAEAAAAKLPKRLPFDPSIPLLGIYPKDRHRLYRNK